MRSLLFSILTVALFYSPLMAQENLGQAGSYLEFAKWVEERDPLWREELFRLEVSGYPEAESLRATKEAILLKRGVLSRLEAGPQAERLRSELERLILSLEQGLEEAFAPASLEGAKTLSSSPSR